MTTLSSISKERSKYVFENVMALYTTLQDNRQALKVRRSQLNMNNKVSAEPLDFLMDVEIKARRALTPVEYGLFLRLSAEGNCKLMPRHLKESLGQFWSRHSLDIDGDYSSLYFRVKNAQEREYMKEKLYGAGDTEPNQFN